MSMSIPADAFPAPAPVDPAHSKPPDGPELFRHWLVCEGSKAWDPLDTTPNGGYEKVWHAWLRSLDKTSLPSASALHAQSKPWHEATAVDVQRFLQPRQGQRSGHLPGRQVSEVTRRRYWRLLERIYEHAREQGWIKTNPAQGLAEHERPASEDGQGHCLSTQLWQSLPRHMPQELGFQAARDRAILLLLYELALAPEEVRGLCWADVLTAQQSIWRPGYAAAPALLHIQGARAAQQRSLQLPAGAAAALRDWSQASSGQRGPSVLAPEATVFYSREGQALSVRVLFHVASQLIQRAHAAQGPVDQKTPLHRVGPQVLRNTTLVQWLREGKPPSEVVELAGLESARALRHLQHYL
ncbi:tyrosine-type recombinase/integrase [Comamonas composti]|uniref:tyrosine-type recombinase/integrase n=1 Tax=Comamonas composti TaxID=408558 RepID=UPI001FDF436D|nr:tyrosine-type recombinase/integrase [Comamonas composti]